MTPERWQRVKVIVEQALECSRDQREQLIFSACNGDESLITEINRMLLAYEAADSFLEIPAHKLLNETTLKTIKLSEKNHEDHQPLLDTNLNFLDKYQLLKIIGKGGMGEVYQARHIELKTMFAIKLLHHHLTMEDGAIERFKREALAAAKLEHVNIVRVFDYGVYNRSCYLIMEYLDGESLRERLKKRARISLPEIARFTEQVCQALTVVHHKGIIHRDLKPENIFFHQQNQQEIVKILDFGIAKTTTLLSNAPSLTNPGDIFGTPHYMSPEQCQAKPLDSRADIYSLGVVLYEMFAGYKPLDADNALSIMYAHVHTEPTDLTRILPEISPEIARVIKQAMAKDPAQRYQSAEQLWQAFSEAIAGKAAIDQSITRSHPPLDTIAISNTNETLLIKPSRPLPATRTAASRSWLIGATIILAIGCGIWSISAKLLAPNPTIVDKKPANSTANKDHQSASSIESQAIKLPADKFVLIAGGNVTIGRAVGDCRVIPDCRITSDEAPPHKEILAPYYLGRFEVTNQEYQQFISEKNHTPPKHWPDQHYPVGEGDLPVTNVSWYDAEQYCQWRAAREAIPYRLASEAEWEYAARGDSAQFFPWGNYWNNSFANVGKSDPAAKHALPVNIAPNYSTDQSSFGIYAMAGNVREWTASDFTRYPFSDYQPTDDDRKCKVFRGGSFNIVISSARTTFRGWDFPDRAYKDLGFRLAVTAK